MIERGENHHFYVYALYRDVEMTDPFYVGKGYGRRVQRHETNGEIAKRHNSRKNNTIKKLLRSLGLVPKKIISDGLPESEAFALEIALIEQYGRLDIGTGCLTNLSAGGCGAAPSAETREKIKIARARQVMSAATREKIRQANLGRRHTAESRAKMSAARKGKAPALSPEARVRQLAAVRGRKHSPEAKAKMSASRTGKPLSAAHIEAIARSNRGLKRSPQARANISAGKRRYYESKRLSHATSPVQ